jgi:hypothetical protein
MAGAFSLQLAGGVEWRIDPPLDPTDDAYVQTARAIRASGLEANTIATFSDGPWDLARFFAELVDSWRGWDGKRRWTALENEMEVEATHNGARVVIGLTIRRPYLTYADDAWTARIVFELEPGEQLANVARELASALSR